MIELKNIHKKFGNLQVLKGVSFSGKSGDCVALIGPNGCGKTTLIKTVLGMVVPDSGSLHVMGKEVNFGWDYRSHIGYMPQIGRYPENMRIGQVIDMLLDIRQYKGTLDEEVIHFFALRDLYDKRMGTLSGGTFQKVSAAIAFLFNPSVLILDEPTAGLDPVSSELLKEKINKEKDKGKLVIITSHILSELDDLVSHVMYMQDGQMIFHKSVEDLRSDTGEERLSRAIAHIMKTHPK